MELGSRSLNSVEVDVRKPAFDVTKIRSLDSVKAEATDLVWRFDAMEFETWIPQLVFPGGGCDKASVEPEV